MNIELPVSIGEALDKLSILEIKLDKIKDERRADVQKEYDAILGKLDHLFTRDAKFHYHILKEVNMRIWNDQDIFRESKDEKRHAHSRTESPPAAAPRRSAKTSSRRARKTL